MFERQVVIIAPQDQLTAKSVAIEAARAAHAQVALPHKLETTL